MKNLQKNTKAELISKLNSLKTKQLEIMNSNTTNISNNPTLFKVILKNILYFKSIILKVTLIALIIKLFKRYSILRRLWTIFNTILVTIFGFSLVDTFHLEILSNLFHNIIDVFTKFQTNLLELFGNKVDVPIETPSRMNQSNKNSTGNEENSTIIERFKQIVHKEPEVIKDEDTPLYKNKYVVIGGILILSGLTWYFYDDLKPIGSSILAWINSSRSQPGSDPSNSRYDSNPNSPWQVSKSLKDWWNKGEVESGSGFISPPTPSPSYKPLKLIKDWWNKDKSAGVESGTNSPFNSPISMGKGKAIDPRELSEKEVERRLWAQTSGENQVRFDQESSVLLQQITHFNDNWDSWKDISIRADLYSTLRGQLLALSALGPTLYFNLVKDQNILNEIDSFIELESRLKTEVNQPETYNQEENQSDTYNEVALATVEEQEVWSDKALSPRAPLSPIIHPKTDEPKSGFASLLDQINSFRNDKDVIDENVPENRAEQTELDEDIQKKVTELFKEDIGVKTDTKQSHNIELPQPEIIVNSGSDDSMDHYFPKSELIQEVVNQPEDSINVKTKLDNFKEDAEAFHQKLAFQNISESIKSRANEVVSTPNVGNIGLQTPIQDRLKLSPLMHKPSISNLFEDTMDLFDEDPIDTAIDTSGESSKLKEDNPDILDKPKSKFSALLQQINSRRLEYGSPTSDSHKEVLIEDPKPADETYSSEDDLNPWKEVKVNIKTGDIYNRFVDIDFGEVRDKVAKILIFTNDGESNYFNPNLEGKKQSQTFRWDNKGINNHYYKDLEIHKIFVIAHNNPHSKEIYTNPDVKILPHYLESIKR